MRHGEPGDPPSYPEIMCPECEHSPCVCEDLALEDDEHADDGPTEYDDD